MMDEAELDPDIDARAMCLDAAMWFIDKTGGDIECAADVTNIAELFLHYLTNGQANEFDCTDSLRKTVRGGS